MTKKQIIVAQITMNNREMKKIREQFTLINKVQYNQFIEMYKKQAIQDFMQRVKDLKQSLNLIKNNSVEHLQLQQMKFEQNFQYINQSFEEIILEVEQKRKQLNNNLITLIQKRKQSVQQTVSMFNTIKDNLERYVFDINKHYEQILGELQLNKFQQIIQQYHAKIQYYQESAGINKHLTKKLPAYQDITVYLPLQELKRIIDKSNVSCYHKQNMLLHNRGERIKGSSSHRLQHNIGNFNNMNNNRDKNIIKSQNDQRNIIKQPKNCRKAQGAIFKEYESQKNHIESTKSYYYH